ncbi:MAG: AAA family ATPase [FCB group bacterium]|nr:AAA family ATPase [FCB group bacterium]
MGTNNHTSMAEYFGWKTHPFSDTWQLDEPFTGQRDKRISDQAISMLFYGKSFAITGPSGSGKSTLIHHLLSKLDANYYLPVLIHYGGLQRSGILRAIADKLGVELTGRSLPLLIKLQKHISTITAGANPIHPVIVIDDAQLMEKESLPDICSLITAPPQKTTTASLILVGDETLAKKMQLAVMTPIRSRLTVNFRMEPLGEQETDKFIAFRLENAKAPKDLFEPDTLALIAAQCRGNRRNIMNMGTLLIAEAFYRKEKTIGSQLLSSTDLLN